MDPLSGEEMQKAVQILKDSGKVNGPTRYPIIRLREMAKADVLRWTPGSPISRSAEVQAQSGADFFRAIVDLDKGTVTNWKTITDGKPIMHSSDYIMSIGLVRDHPEWLAALKKRGIANTGAVKALPFFRGYWGNEDDKKGNIYRMYAYYSPDQKNYWGRPIGGLSAVVDLFNKKVLHVIDTGVVAMPDGSSDYDAASNEPVRRGPNPVKYQQEGGPTYSFNGNVVSWGQWKFHLRFEQQEGLVLSNLTFDGRSVLYQGSVSELFVPYMDPTEHWYFRNFMDAGEGGLGISTSPMLVGVDCPENATLLSPVMANDNGKGSVRKDAIAIYERYSGDPSWRHMDPLTRQTDGGRAQMLVVRSIATVGNYDYVFDWNFDSTGGIKVRVGATGICSSKPVDSKTALDDATGKDGAYGRFVDSNLVAVNHDHFIAYRLDFDVDGQNNTFVKERLTPVRFNEGTPRISGWQVEPSIAKTENDAKLVLNPQEPTYWRLLSNHQKNQHGYNTSYQITPSTTNYISMLNPRDWAHHRGAFSKYNLYVTPYHPDERYAGGLTPNQNEGLDGLDVWAKADRPIENTDIVAWYTLGFHHVVRAEDWPVMPTAWHDFYIRPFDFSNKNPLMSVARK
jgi:primary-amine oxidase